MSTWQSVSEYFANQEVLQVGDELIDVLHNKYKVIKHCRRVLLLNMHTNTVEFALGYVDLPTLEFLNKAYKNYKFAFTKDKTYTAALPTGVVIKNPETGSMRLLVRDNLWHKMIDLESCEENRAFTKFNALATRDILIAYYGINYFDQLVFTSLEELMDMT